MKKAKFTVMGATGNIGKQLTKLLLQEGHQVKAVVRSADKAKELKDLGAELVVGDAGDAAFLTKAFSGVEAVFAMIPPDYTAQNFRAFQNKTGQAIATAITNSGVKQVVNLSSLGAELASGSGPILGLHDQEERLNKLDINLVHLRPSYFFENVFFGFELIKTQGIYGTPIAPDVKFAQIATKDIAQRGKEILVAGKIQGKSVQELLGKNDLSMLELTETLGKALAKPSLSYVQFPNDAAHKAMVQAGLSPDVASMFIQLYEATNARAIKPLKGRSPQSTTPTSFADFAKTLG